MMTEAAEFIKPEVKEEKIDIDDFFVFTTDEDDTLTCKTEIKQENETEETTLIEVKEENIPTESACKKPVSKSGSHCGKHIRSNESLNRLKLHETLIALEAADEDELHCGGIVLHFPDSEILTDEDSEASDEEIEGDINHLGKGLLNSGCDFIPHSVGDDDTEEMLPEDLKNCSGNKKVKVSFQPTWNYEAPVFHINSSRHPPALYSHKIQETTNELELIKLFFDDDIIDNIVSQTNIYAQQKNVALNVTKEELWVIFGGMLLSGYAKYPNKRLYWSTQNDAPSILSDAIRCNRFELILHHLHLNDNSNLDPSDPLYKLRPFLNPLCEKFLELYELEENLSIDQSMIPYFAEHYAKQFIKGKTIRFGFKYRALCSSNGYMYAFDLYTGRRENEAQNSEGLDVGGQIVKHLLAKANVKGNEGYKVYFNNYFTSYKLLESLSKDSVCATGTVRENRLANCPLSNKFFFSKLSKGSAKFASTSCVMAVRYKDNKVFTIASNFASSEMSTTKKYSKEKKTFVPFPQPLVVKNYNKFMGGVDQLDQWVASYRTRMRQRKWWWPIFVYFFDVTIVNAWILWKKKHNKTPLLDFRRNLANTILKSYGTPLKQGKTQRVLKGVRFDGMHHWLQSSTMRRCAFCPGKALFSCTKCNVGLHPKCHKDFHMP